MGQVFNLPWSMFLHTGSRTAMVKMYELRGGASKGEVDRHETGYPPEWCLNYNDTGVSDG